jgi:hypothetical protein
MAPRVTLTCFAGRRRYLEVLTTYVNELLDKGLVDEFHLWDYTRDPEDAKWIQENCQKYKIFEVQDKSTWKEYYEYYGNLKWTDPMAIYIKCDDDIVFIDVEAFKGFIHNRIENPNNLLAFPSIVNNGVSTMIQSTLGVWKDVNFENAEDTAGTLHRAFLADPDAFVMASRAHYPRKCTLNYNSHIFININFFAILAKDLNVFLQCWENDELNLSTHIPKWSHRHNYLDPSFVVSHMAFTRQRENGFDEGPYLEKYRALSKLSVAV